MTGVRRTGAGTTAMQFARAAMAAAGVIASGLLAPTGTAQAQLLCNGCTPDQYQAMADIYADAPGTILVYDVRNAQLTGWRGVKDRETGDMHVESTAVPTATMTAYLNILHLVTTQRGDAWVTLTPDLPPGPGPYYGYNPLNGYGSFNAYDIVRSANINNTIGNLLASGLRGHTGNTSFDNAVGTLVSFLMAGIIPETNEIRINVVIVWKDGSKSVYTVNSGMQAEYQSGKSVDPSGNPIPEANTVNDPSDATFAGREMHFGNDADLFRWVERMRLFGVPITGMQTHRIACVRIGNGPLSCKYI